MNRLFGSAVNDGCESPLWVMSCRDAVRPQCPLYPRRLPRHMSVQGVHLVRRYFGRLSIFASPSINITNRTPKNTRRTRMRDTQNHTVPRRLPKGFSSPQKGQRVTVQLIGFLHSLQLTMARSRWTEAAFAGSILRSEPSIECRHLIAAHSALASLWRITKAMALHVTTPRLSPGTLKAANQDLALAEFNLGAMYANGIGTRKHQAQAAICRKPADHRFTGLPVGRFFS